MTYYQVQDSKNWIKIEKAGGRVVRWTGMSRKGYVEEEDI